MLVAGYTLCTCLSTQAQSTQATAQEFSKTISGKDIYAHLSFLASDVLEGRETGERGQKIAAQYIQSHFMRMGLQPGVPSNNSYFQQYFLNLTEIKGATLTTGSTKYEYKKDFFALRGALPEKFQPDFAFAGYGISTPAYDNLKGLNLTGKTALVFGGEPQPIAGGINESLTRWMERIPALQAAGATGVCFIIPDSVFTPVSRYASSRIFEIADKPIENTDKFPVLFLSELMGEQLLKTAKAKSGKLKTGLTSNPSVPKLSFSKLKPTYTSEITRKVTPTENVLAFMKGSEFPDELLILTAHFDHIGITRGQVNNGADDDGSGTSAILEIAEAFSLAAKAGYTPRRSILFMTVSGEEKGLLGSKFYTDHPVYPLKNSVVNLNIDMIGRIDPKYEKREDSANYVYLIGSDKLSSELHTLSETVNTQNGNITLDYLYNDENHPERLYYRSDHYNFAKNNIPVIFYFTGIHKDYHRPSDDIEKIHFDKTAKIAQLVFLTAWEIANRDKRIIVDKKQ